jgi:hypothetical protein
MQAEMERGGKLFFDLFVALCNHMVSLLGLLFFGSLEDGVLMVYE